MAALRASITIAPEVLRKFNEMVPAGERSQDTQSLMQQALAESQKRMEAIAEEFDTHPDFRIARGRRGGFRNDRRRRARQIRYGDRVQRNLLG